MGNGFNRFSRVLRKVHSKEQTTFVPRAICFQDLQCQRNELSGNKWWTGQYANCEHCTWPHVRLQSGRRAVQSVTTDGGGRPGVKQGSKSRSTQTQPRPRLIHTLRSVLFTAPINKSNRRYKLDVHFHSYHLGDDLDRVLFAENMLKSVTKELKNNKNQGQQRRLA